MNNNVFALIDFHQQRLSNHLFCKRLRECASTDKSIFHFVPHMSFFVLGFRDLLEYLRVPFPRTPAELMLNEHCKEDSDHWLWFLQDLETLQLPAQAWGGATPTDTLELLWSPQNAAVRRQVYDLMIMVNNCKDAHEKLILVECLESAFAALIESLNVYTKRIGIYEKLAYFGKQHNEKEAEHSMGSWLEAEDARQHKAQQAAVVVRYPVIEQMVNDIFAGFDAIFSCWEKHMGRSIRKVAPMHATPFLNDPYSMKLDNRVGQMR